MRTDKVRVEPREEQDAPTGSKGQQHRYTKREAPGHYPALKKADEQEEANDSYYHHAEHAPTQSGPREREGSRRVRWGKAEGDFVAVRCGVHRWHLFFSQTASAYTRFRPKQPKRRRPVKLAHRSSVW